MVATMDDERSARSRLKSTLLTLLQAGAGSLVLATTALIAPPAPDVTRTPIVMMLKRLSRGAT